MGYKITPLKLGTIIRKKSNMIYHCGDDTPMTFPLISFLLEGNGHKVLVDTGGSVPDGQKWMPYARSEKENLVEALRVHGVSPEEIDTVFFTHLHWDHAGGNDSLVNARFFAQKKEYDYIKDEERPGFERDLVIQKSYQLLAGNVENVIEGVSVILTPGHSVGSQSIVVDSENGMCVIAGNLFPTFYNVEHCIPNGGNYDVEIITDSMKKVLALGFPVLPGHEL